MKGRTVFGLTATILYLGAVGCWVYKSQAQFLSLQPNAVGDFLAGVFGPLAFLWLVLGYFQQGDELQQNTKALEMQARELEISVRHQGELVEVTRQQLQADIDALQQDRVMKAASARPKFRFTPSSANSGPGYLVLRYRCLNVGNSAMDIHFLPNPADTPLAPPKYPVLHKGEQAEVAFTIYNGRELPTQLVVRFVDAAGQPGESVFLIGENESDGKHWTIAERT